MKIDAFKQDVQLESTLTRAPTSENLFQNLGGNVQFINEAHVFTHTWKINGNYGTTAGEFSVDNLFVFRNKANGIGVNVEIVDVVLSVDKPGTTGFTDIDLKVSTTPGGGFTSIFSTRPGAGPSAPQYSWAGVGDSVTGFQSPVFVSGSSVVCPFNSGVRMDIVSTMLGNPEGVNITIYYRPIST